MHETIKKYWPHDYYPRAYERRMDQLRDVIKKQQEHIHKLERNLQRKDNEDDETTDDDQPPLGNANDPGVAAAAEELFQAAPVVILQNRRRRPRDSDSSDEELNALRRDYPSYSRTALRQLRAAIQRNQRRRLA